MSLCLKYLMKLREAWSPFLMEKQAASSLCVCVCVCVCVFVCVCVYVYVFYEGGGECVYNIVWLIFGGWVDECVLICVCVCVCVLKGWKSVCKSMCVCVCVHVLHVLLYLEFQHKGVNRRLPAGYSTHLLAITHTHAHADTHTQNCLLIKITNTFPLIPN